MKLASNTLLLFAGLLTFTARAQITQFQHVIVIVQENRTPDNLFQGLCNPPFGVHPPNCSGTPKPTQYNIQTAAEGWLDHGKKITPGTVSLAPNRTTHNGQYDLNHGHSGFVAMCDLTGGACKMDNANNPDACRKKKGTVCPANAPMKYVDNSSGLLNPYLELAKQYGWANYMFQTNQGPSFPAHQFLFGGTSAPAKAEDHAGVFAAENMSGTGVSGTGAKSGCTAPNGPPPKPETRVKLINAEGSETSLLPNIPVSSTRPWPMCSRPRSLGDITPRTPPQSGLLPMPSSTSARLPDREGNARESSGWTT